MRITHLGKFFHPAHGGIERSLRSLAHAQAGLGCSVRVICMDHERGRPNRVEWDGPVEVVRVRRARSFGKLDHCPDLPRLIRDTEADILHLHTPNPTMILGLLLSGDQRPLVVSHYSDVVKQHLRSGALQSDRTGVLRPGPADLVGIATLHSRVSRAAALSRPGGRPADRPGSCPIPGPGARGRGESRSLEASIPARSGFSAAGSCTTKDSKPRCLALRSVPGTLLIVGDGPERTRLEHFAARLDLKDRARFLGDVPRDEDLAAYYLASDAFWFPSNARSETYGLVQVEAMASGCPVINAAIPHSGVPWVSRHEETGLTVPVNDPAAFAAAALRLLEEPGLRDRLAAGARARAIAEFQCEAMGRRSLALYGNMLDAPIGARSTSGATNYA